MSSSDPDAAFNKDTAVMKQGEGIYSAYVQPRWSVGTHPNGGYLVSMIISAMRGELNFRDPLTVTSHFLSPTAQGQPCEIRVEVIKRSRRGETATATMVQEHEGANGETEVRERVRVIGSFGKLPVAGEEGEAQCYTRTPVPSIPPPEQCMLDVGTPELRKRIPLREQVEMRVDPSSSWARRMCMGERGPAGEPEYTAWVRFSDGRQPCLRSMAFFNDGFSPPVLNCVEGRPWVPTMEYTLHCLRRPREDLCRDRWMLLNYKCDVLAGGRLVAETTLWDTEGNLVSQSRQMAMLGQSPSPAAAKKGA